MSRTALDVVEPGRDVIVREQVFDLDRRGQQVAERGLVFRPVQPPERDAPLVPLPVERCLVQLPMQPGDHRAGLVLGRTRLALRRHLSAR